MVNNQNQKSKAKNRGQSGQGVGVQKYPADKNFFPREGKPSAEKPHGKKPYHTKPYGKRSYEGTSYGDKSRESGKRPYHAERRPDWDKTYDKVTPRNEGSHFDSRSDGGTPMGDDEDESGNTTPDAGLVIGRNAVRELLRSDRTVDKLLVRRGDREGSIVLLVAEAVDKGIPVVEVDRSKLDNMAGFVPHQGVIAMVAQKEYVSVEDILAIAAERGEPPLLVIADGITDPYNLGALIRCAEGVGAHGLIIPRRRAVGLTALVAKASAGAMEHLAVAKVSNVAGTIQMLQRKGIWCYAAEAGGQPYYDTDFTGPCALVFGSEGNGVSRIVKEACDRIVSIPMYGKVNSFNVSTAAAVILSESARQHRNSKSS